MRHFLFTLAVIMTIGVHAQEQFGIAASNYAGTDAMALDPARGVLQWQYLDVNLIGVSANVWNNLVFLPGDRYSLLGEVSSGINGNSQEIQIGMSLSNRTKKAFVATKVHAPGFLLSLGRGALGLNITSRAYVNALGVQPHLARFIEHGLNYSPQVGERYHDKHIRLSSAAWTEAALNYSHIIKSTENDLLSIGGTVKYLMGHFGSAMQFDVFDYEVLDSARFMIHEVSGSYGVATPGTNAGKGFGADLGFHYQRTLKSAERYRPHRAPWCEPIEYRYRVSFSILDLGALRFNNAYAGEMDLSAGEIADYEHVDVDGLEGVDSLFSATVDQFQPDNTFKVGLPTAAMLQYDQRIIKNVYASATVVQPLAPRSSLRLRRASVISIAPRYETKRFEVAVPVTMREFNKPLVGLMLRLNNIIIGSDHLMPFVARRDIYGMDFYFRIKFTMFRSPGCRSGRAPKTNSKGQSAMPCARPN